MSLLIPLLVPPLAELTAGLAVGVANAVQGDKSDFSFTIGKKVFSTYKPFPFNGLPFELRQKILLAALELSKSLLPPPPSPLPAGHPFVTPSHPLYHHPLNPHNPAYIAPTGERARNGYPTSTWRWLTLCREWWAVIRPVLWRDVVLKGASQYKGFLNLLQDPDSCYVKGFVKTIELREGFEETWEMYAVLRHLTEVEGIVYAPYPRETHMFPFGLNVIPNTPGPRRITIDKLPFDRITTPSTRAHLRMLPRLEALSLYLSVLTPEIGSLLASLPGLKELALHLPSLHPSLLAPFARHPLNGQSASHLLSDTPRPDEADSRQRLSKLEVHALIVHADHVEALCTFLRNDAVLARAATVFGGTDEQVVYAPSEEAAVELAVDRDRQSAEATESAERWERTTNLRLFGGLLGLRMESRR